MINRIAPALLVLAVFQSACVAPVDPVPARSLGVSKVEDMGPLSMPAHVLGRDGGASALVGGRVLWTFGDTFISPVTSDGSSIRSSTAAWGTVADPLNLSEPLDASGAPGEFIPFTADEAAANTADALNGWAVWPGPVVGGSDSQAVLVFDLIRRIKGTGFESHGVGIARVNTGESVATRDAGLLFAPPDPLFGSGGVVRDGEFAYLYSCAIVSFLNMGCKLARAAEGMADQRAAYTFYDGTDWVADITKAKVVIEHAAAGMTVSWNSWLNQYVAVHSELLGNRIQLRTAPRPEGPWSASLTIETSPTGIQASVPSGTTNYLAQEHIALSSVDGHSLVVGYSRPLAPFRGEVRLVRITLKD